MTHDKHRPDHAAAPSPEELRTQVDEDREELGETIEALAAKTDIKARAQEKTAAAKQQAAEKTALVKTHAAETAAQVRTQVQANRTPLLAVGGAALTVLLLLRWRKHR
ncbi:DUF3618 domain-containing protein [Streptomyces sp. NPDC054829]